MSKDFIVFEGGAKRGDSKPMYRKIPYGPNRRRALTYTEGSMKYDEGLYDTNWKKGDPEFAAACFDHVIDHMYKWISGDTSEDHLAHAGVGIDFLMEFEDRGIFVPSNPPEEKIDPAEYMEEAEQKQIPLFSKIAELLGAAKK